MSIFFQLTFPEPLNASPASQSNTFLPDLSGAYPPFGGFRLIPAIADQSSMIPYPPPYPFSDGEALHERLYRKVHPPLTFPSNFRAAIVKRTSTNSSSHSPPPFHVASP